MQRTYESALPRSPIAPPAPLANQLDEFVASLTDQQYVPAVVYAMALHALAFDYVRPPASILIRTERRDGT
jgi:hypothetical protein